MRPRRAPTGLVDHRETLPGLHRPRLRRQVADMPTGREHAPARAQEPGHRPRLGRRLDHHDPHRAATGARPSPRPFRDRPGSSRCERRPPRPARQHERRRPGGRDRVTPAPGHRSPSLMFRQGPARRLPKPPPPDAGLRSPTPGRRKRICRPRPNPSQRRHVRTRAQVRRRPPEPDLSAYPRVCRGLAREPRRGSD